MRAMPACRAVMIRIGAGALCMLASACSPAIPTKPSLSQAAAHPDATPQPARVCTALGCLAGQEAHGMREFLGIPYARPPIGALRFAPPEPVAPWQGTRSATVFGNACPQDDPALMPQQMLSEDCLSLNVYAPSAASQLPVMVFIHGGAFVAGGSSQYDAKTLASAGVLVVTINYRLGALGFLSLPALDAERKNAPSGSDGFRDQQLALRWVHDHVAAFGGDPSNVTVFGESAGAISACLHWVAPGSRELARRYILESGACTSDAYAVQDKAEADQLGNDLSHALCPGAADELACLRQLPVSELLRWGATRGQFGPPWRPTIEGAGGALPAPVEELIAASSGLAPLILGTNAHEWGLFQYLGAPKPDSRAKLARVLSTTFGAGAEQVAKQYPVGADAAANDAYVDYVTDVAFRCPTRNLARLATEHGAPVYLYSFEQGHAFHAQELDYVFGDNVMSYYYDAAPPSAALSTSVQRYWTRFAQSGDPNGSGDPQWPRYQADSDRHLVLVDPPRVGHGLARRQCEFWQDYIERGGKIDLQ
jgi:para-nitrobenzyl esterase